MTHLNINGTSTSCKGCVIWKNISPWSRSHCEKCTCFIKACHNNRFPYLTDFLLMQHLMVPQESEGKLADRQKRKLRGFPGRDHDVYWTTCSISNYWNMAINKSKFEFDGLSPWVPLRGLLKCFNDMQPYQQYVMFNVFCSSTLTS